MQKFISLTGIAAPLPLVNVDTDRIIPKQFLKTIERSGLAKGLFYDLRHDANGQKADGFVLDRPPYTKAEVLITGDNFGCGSSREHAPWALLDFGIRCVIAPGIADIFHSNCFKNGVLPIVLPQDGIDALMADAQDVENPILTVDLTAQQIRRPNGAVIEFEIDPFQRHCLLNGLDDIGLTLEKRDRIAAYEARRQRDHAWLNPHSS